MYQRTQLGIGKVKDDLNATKDYLLTPYENAGICIGDLFVQVNVIASDATNNIELCTQNALTQISDMQIDVLMYVESINDQILEIEKVLGTCEAASKFQFEINLCVFSKVSFCFIFRNWVWVNSLQLFQINNINGLVSNINSDAQNALLVAALESYQITYNGITCGLGITGQTIISIGDILKILQQCVFSK